ncbi:FxLYD domain-containing protein [Streptomyces anulatus]|uniref:FxLYD domain-containing protein n=1 Tax=Streptomyces anulatus TaxID=1892 RepID=UPI0023D93007|nr:FxLYD domain-containing protein [Streptomyces anulatus]
MSQQYPQGQQPQGWGQQPPQWGGQPPAPKKSNAGKVIGFGCLGAVALLVVLGAVGMALGGTDSGSDTGSDGVLEVTASPSEGAAKEKAPEAEAEAPKGAEGDVKITACEVDSAMQWPSASLDVTNRSSKTSNYIVQVEFVDKDGTRLGEGTAALNNLAPGQVSKEKAQGLTQVSGKVECRVTKVTRYAS